MKTSNFLSLNLQDFGKGLIVAVGSAVLAAVYNVLQAGSLNFDWKAIGIVAVSAGVSYLAKNFLTPPSIVTPVTSK